MLSIITNIMYELILLIVVIILFKIFKKSTCNIVANDVQLKKKMLIFFFYQCNLDQSLTLSLSPIQEPNTNIKCNQMWSSKLTKPNSIKC